MKFPSRAELGHFNFRAETELKFFQELQSNFQISTSIMMIITNCMKIYMNLYKTKGLLGTWKLWFSYINEKKIFKNLNFSWFQPIFDFELKRKRSWAKPSWKSISSSSGLSQLGSDSSLLNMFAWAFLKLYDLTKSCLQTPKYLNCSP